MRNQFGGHAVAPAPRRRPGHAATQPTPTHERRAPGARRPPVPARLPLLRRLDVDARAGRHRVRRPQRAGQDQPRRGDRLPLPARLAPGRRATRRWCGPAPSRPWSGRPWCATAASALLEVEINPGTSNRARINRSPLPRARELLGLVRTVRLLPRGPRPWSRATRPTGAASSTTCWCCGRRGSPASAPTTTGCSSSATRCSRPPAPRGAGRPRSEGALATLEVWDAHLARARRRAARRPARAGRRAAPATSARPTRRWRAGAARDDADIAYKPSLRRSPAATTRRRPRRRSTDALLAEVERRRDDELDRGITLVGPHRDELVLLGSAPLPVKGYASHGESWSFALALRLASYDLLRADGDDPVLILDDVFAELDTERRAAAGRAGRRRRAGAGHRRGRRRRAGGAGGHPLRRSRRGGTP